MVTDAGAALLGAVAIMDRLRSPGGCPWDAAQTHRSLAPYLLEETYETLEAIETDDPVLLREELGDLLLQVLFHARLGEELPNGQCFTIHDVATDLTNKLVRRHPHVFADTPATDVEAVEQNWDQIRRAEKQRTSAVDGVVLAQPALALAAKLVSRSRRAGVEIELGAGNDFGTRLFALAAEAAAAGVDPEQALRDTARDYAEAVRTEEFRAAQQIPR